MKIACKVCNQLYEDTKEKMSCPHDLIKESLKACEEHNNLHCGMPNCSNLIEIKDYKKRKEA
jgi:uncharacterized membrane-anchored protein YjiN (DUF445 family)